MFSSLTQRHFFPVYVSICISPDILLYIYEKGWSKICTD